MKDFAQRMVTIGSLSTLNTLMASRRGQTECWPWAGKRDALGYGRYYKRGCSTDGLAHRASWEVFIGVIPTELVIDHLCRNRACVNPSHLEPVTLGENTRRGATKTHCVRGHELTDKTVVHLGNGKRICRACRKAVYGRYRDVWRARYLRIKATQPPIVKQCKQCGKDWEVHHGGVTLFCSKSCKQRWHRQRRGRA